MLLYLAKRRTHEEINSWFYCPRASPRENEGGNVLSVRTLLILAIMDST